MDVYEVSSIDDFERLPKSDLHSHAPRGGNLIDVVPNYNETIRTLPKKFTGLGDMQTWYEKNVKVHCIGKEGYIKRIKAAFIQAHRDNVRKLSMSFGFGESVFFENVKEYIDTLSALHQKYAPNTIFIPEISFYREQSSEQALQELKRILPFNFFKSIDLFGNENLGVDNFIPVFALAKEHNFILKAHVGEYCEPHLIVDAVEKLNLTQIQHGITAVKSETVMKYLKDSKISLNICPTSNVMLSFVDEIANHPIRKLYDFGIDVTINTDDLLIFNSTLSNEYRRLFKENVFSLNELNDIRLKGLNKRMY